MINQMSKELLKRSYSDQESQVHLPRLMKRGFISRVIKMPSNTSNKKVDVKKTSSKKIEEKAGSKRKTSAESEQKDKIPKFELKASLPTKSKNGQLAFEDWPSFLPNKTPAEVLQAGSFGGTYFRPIYSSVTKKKYGDEVWKELPEEWLEGLKIKSVVASSVYDTNFNKYKVKCGASLEEWENSGWIKEQDPYGWFQWYCRFYSGRRSEDDERQVGRWQRCCGEKGRWKQNLVSKIVKAGAEYDDVKISPVVRQTLLHWAYELTKKDFEKGAKKVKK